MKKNKMTNLLIGYIVSIVLAYGISYISANSLKNKNNNAFNLFGSSSKTKKDNKAIEKNNMPYDEEYIMNTLNDLITEAKEPIESDFYKIDKDWLDNTEKATEEFKIPERDIIVQDHNGHIIKIISYPDKYTKVIKEYEYDYWYGKERLVNTTTYHINDKGMIDGEHLIKSNNKYKEYVFYKDGNLENRSEKRYANGEKEEKIYENGIKGKANATYYFSNGDKEIYKYNSDGKIEGDAEYIYSDGTKEKYRYVNGRRFD